MGANGVRLAGTDLYVHAAPSNMSSHTSNDAACTALKNKHFNYVKKTSGGNVKMMRTPPPTSAGSAISACCEAAQFVPTHKAIIFN